jgi:macrolide-specific efflux system membrane fusion protein
MDVYFTTMGNQAKRWYGKLRQIEPTPVTVNNVVLYNALFDVANADQSLMTQMTAQVFFVVAQAKDAVLVPVGALRPVSAGGSGARNRASAPAASKSAGAAGDAKDSAAKGGSRQRAADSGIDPRARFANGRALVRVMNADGSVEQREVRVGVMSRVSAQILSGLEPGEKVVTGQAQTQPVARAKSNDTPRMQPRI